MQQPVIATFYDHILDIAKQEGCSVQEALSEAKQLGVTALEVSCMWTLCRGLRPVLTRATSTSPGRTHSRLLTGFGAA